MAQNDKLMELILDISNELDINVLCHKILVNVCRLTKADRSSLFLARGPRGKRYLEAKLFDVKVDTGNLTWLPIFATQFKLGWSLQPSNALSLSPALKRPNEYKVSFWLSDCSPIIHSKLYNFFQFENHSKYRSIFTNLLKLTIFGLFDEFLSTQYVLFGF